MLTGQGGIVTINFVVPSFFYIFKVTEMKKIILLTYTEEAQSGLQSKDIIYIQMGECRYQRTITKKQEGGLQV